MYDHLYVRGALPGTAAIDFQISSSLAKSLTNLFQMVMDFRDNLDYSKVADNLPDQRAYRISAVSAYFKNTIMQKFKDIVNKETGLTISKMHVFSGEDLGVLGLFAVDLSFGAGWAAEEWLGSVTGNETWTSPKWQDAIEELRHLSECIDLKSSRLKKQTFGPNKKKCAVEIYFDVNCAFLVQDYLPAKLAPAFTAAELAAILMHEIGHAMTVIEHAADYYASYRRVNNFAQQFKHLKGLEAQKFIVEGSTYLMQFFREFKTNLRKDSPFIKPVLAVCDLLSAACKGLQNYTKAEADPESWFTTISHFIGNTILAMFQFVLISACSVVSFVMLMELMYEFSKLTYQDENGRDLKATDSKANYNNTFLLERWADEFVSRHGYGAELATALNKINDYFTYGVIGSLSSHRLRNSTLVNALCFFQGWLFDKILWFSYLEPVGYENQYQRNYRILQNTYGFFKSNEVPGQVRDMWIRNIENLKKEVEKSKKMLDTDFGKALWQTMRNLVNPFNWFSMIKSGNLDRDTEILMNRLDDISNNKFFYLGAKIQQR